MSTKPAATSAAMATMQPMMIPTRAPVDIPEEDEEVCGGGDGGGGGGYVPVKGAWVIADTVSAPPATLTDESMVVAALASVVAALMLDWTEEADAAGVEMVTSITTLPAVTVTATSAAVAPLPAVVATAALMPSITVVV